MSDARRIRINAYYRGYFKRKSLELQKEIYQILGNKCSMCGNNDIRVLETHHIKLGGRKDRIKNTNSYMYKKYILNQIKNGSRDFELLCANCHKIKHCR